MVDRSLEISQTKGDVIGAGIDGSGHIIGKEINVHGNVIQLVDPSPEAIAQLMEIASIKTEVTTSSSSGALQTSVTPQEPDKLEKTISELLDILKSSVGKESELQAGALQLSRVDLLLKKSILIKTEADQMYFDQISKNSPKQTRQSADGGSARTKVDLSNLLEGFDHQTHTNKLREAYQLLQEANEIDPTNVEVLLHMAQLLIELTPDDPNDERQLLYRVQKLLHSPQNETDRFHLAQATFLIATSNNQIHEESLRDVRERFYKLGKNEWVRQCDDLLASCGTRTPPVSNQLNPDQNQATDFQPIGRWQVRVSDPANSILNMILYQNGTFEALQQSNFLNVQAAGHWIFNPYNRMLQLQGLIGGIRPFMLGIMIQGFQGNGYLALGTDGYTYFLTSQ